MHSQRVIWTCAWTLVAMLTVSGCGESATPILGCEPSERIIPDCRFQNPEDLAIAPDGGQLLVSQMGSMDGSISGDLVVYRPADGRIAVLFPPQTMAVEDDRSWGGADCPPPDLAAFSPHGIDLIQRSDGRWMLLVVNHGGRESVEFLEVLGSAERIALVWRGCAEGPDQAAFNDVVARADGGFYVSQMMPQDSQFSALLTGALFGSDTGFVYRFSATEGFRQVSGSAGPFPNGLELSADERALYINMYLSGEVVKLDLDSGEVLAVAQVASPDNSTWATDGSLLVASHTDGFLASTACQGLEAGSCGFAFRIVALDPDDLDATTVLENQGAPMGGATVALEFDGDLFLGTFAGDRVARVPGRSDPSP